MVRKDRDDENAAYIELSKQMKKDAGFKYYNGFNLFSVNMEDNTGNSIDELLKWVISIDRRYVLIKTMKKHSVVKASDIAHETSRSTQNISRALNELQDKGLIECLTPEKTTWKKFMLTDLGREVLKKLDEKYS